jgi:hypothetical protein
VKVGLIVDGTAEYQSLASLYPQLHAAISNRQFLKVLKADLQPHAPYPVMARSCRPRLHELEGRGADQIVILLDRETRGDCPGDIATALAQAAASYVACDVAVVVKDRCFENWLISDPGAVKSQLKRFKLSKADEKMVTPNKADHIDGHSLLKKAALGEYEKVQDGKRILASASIDEMAQHSRSFRRLLRVVGHPSYANQSRVP